MKCTTIVLFLLRTERTSNLIRLLVRSVRSKNSTMVVHFIINQIAAAVSDRTISLRAFASPILGAPVVSRLRSALHTDPSGRRPLRTDAGAFRQEQKWARVL